MTDQEAMAENIMRSCCVIYFVGKPRDIAQVNISCLDDGKKYVLAIMESNP